MEEQGQHESQDHTSPISTPVNVGTSDTNVAASSSRVHEEEDEDEGVRGMDGHAEIGEEEQMHGGYLSNFSMRVFETRDSDDDAWSCLAVVVSFWFFASMTLMLGLYGSVTMNLGPNTSRLFQANSFLVDEIRVHVLTGVADELMLYGFKSVPALDVDKNWSDSHLAALSDDAHKEWIYFLNTGSLVNITYHVKSPSSCPVSLVIAKGRESLLDWIDDPSYPNITFSWNIVQGSGIIQQYISESTDYYVAVGNLFPEEVEVELDIRIQSVMYNASNASSKCYLSNGSCGVELLFLQQNAAVLTSSIPKEGSTSSEEWYVKVSYEPKWISYIVVSGAVTMLVLFAFKGCIRQYSNSDESGLGAGDMRFERAPLLNQKDDNCSSWGSSYDSLPAADEDFEEQLAANSLELKDGEKPYSRRLCAICFDAPRDCFFLPCGHCAACFSCGTRIAEEAGICPICRRKMKKVRKIFTV